MKIRATCLALASLVSFNAAAQDSDAAGVCDSCTTKADFELFAEGLVGMEGPGQYLTHVYNMDTDILYRVNVIKENEPGGMLVVANGFRADSSKENAVVELEAFLKGSEYLFMLPDNLGFTSFSEAGFEHQIVCPTIHVGHSALNITDGVIGRAVNVAIGNEPHIIAIFNNGDVARYAIKDVRPGSASCRYVDGTARDGQGDPISDAVQNPTHPDYVTPGSGSGGGLIAFVVRMGSAIGGYDYYSCARSGGTTGPIQCEKL